VFVSSFPPRQRERERGRYLLNATTNKQTNMLKSKDAASSLVSKISLT